MTTQLTFCIEEIKEFFGEDLDILLSVYEDFKSQHKTLETQVKESLRIQDFKTLERSLHTLKGIFRNFFAHELTDLLQQLEEQAQSSNSDNFQEKVDQYIKMASLFFIQFDDYLKACSES